MTPSSSHSITFCNSISALPACPVDSRAAIASNETMTCPGAGGPCAGAAKDNRTPTPLRNSARIGSRLAPCPSALGSGSPRNHAAMCGWSCARNSSVKLAFAARPSGCGRSVLDTGPVNSLAPRLTAVIFPASSTRRSGSLMLSSKARGQSARRFSSAFRFRC